MIVHPYLVALGVRELKAKPTGLPCSEAGLFVACVGYERLARKLR